MDKFNKNNSTNLILSIIIFTGFILSLIFLLNFNQKQIVLPILLANEINKIKYLKIPLLEINSIVESIGLASDGTMGVPTSPDNVAWFNLGVIPGEIGSAVIAGHSGWKNNIPAVFDDLIKLNIGEKIYVEDEKGVIIVFVVREKKLYDPKADATDVFISNDGKAHLNLITCEGVWDEVSKTHSKRLVVFTDKE